MCWNEIYEEEEEDEEERKRSSRVVYPRALIVRWLPRDEQRVAHARRDHRRTPVRVRVNDEQPPAIMLGTESAGNGGEEDMRIMGWGIFWVKQCSLDAAFEVTKCAQSAVETSVCSN